MTLRNACVGLAALMLIAAGCKQTQSGTSVQRASTGADRKQPDAAVQPGISPSTVSDNDEMVEGVIPANTRKVRDALLAVIKEEELKTADTKGLGNVDGAVDVQPNVGSPIRIEYQVAGEDATRLRIQRNPRKSGVKADPVLRMLFDRTRAKATAGR